MKKQTNIALVLMMISICFLYLVSCKKSNSTIVGTWTFRTERDHNFSNNTSVSDTTFNTPPITVTFNANGVINANVSILPLPSQGTYTLNGNTLNYFDSSSFTYGSLIINNLTANSFNFTFNDTTSFTPVAFDQVTYGFTR